MDLTAIRDFYSLSDTLATAGQPTEEQFDAVREAGFEVVINLAWPTSDEALPDEDVVVAEHGMTYIGIPVRWQAPTLENLNAFCDTVDANADRKLFVHCIANKRVSMFLYLYRVLRLGWTTEQAAPDLHAQWTPDNWKVWEWWEDFRQLALKNERRPG